MQTKLEITLAKLVSIPSVTHDSVTCHEIIDFVRRELEPLGLFITQDLSTPSPWLIATTQDTKTLDVILDAHLDIVPAAPELFIMQKKDGKLHGRGVFDMKFAAACYIEFAKAHVDILSTLNIGFLFSTDEEVVGNTVDHVLRLGWNAKCALIPDGGDNWKIEERAKGFFHVEITTLGKTGHGSRPWEGDNALHRILDICHALRAEYPLRGKSDATLSINIMNGGRAANQIADQASVVMDFRCFDKTELAQFQDRIASLAKTHGATTLFRAGGDPLHFDKQSPAVQDFLQAMRSTTGKDIEYSESYGGTDGRHFASHGIPSIIVEPFGGNRHASNEWILADDLVKFYQLIKHWLLSPT